MTSTSISRSTRLSTLPLDPAPAMRLIRDGAHGLVAVDLDDGFGLLHPAAGSVGVVLFGSWAYEDLCLRRVLPALGDALAGIGLPVMRFDLTGVADSPAPRMPDDLEAWIDVGRRAADGLRRASGCSRLIFAGFGLGATLAAAAAGGRDDVAGLCLIGPVQSGRRYVREVATTCRLMYEALGLTAPARERLELAGEAMSETLTKAIGALDLTAEVSRRKVHAADTLILARSDVAIEPRLVEALRAGGGGVEVAPFEDFAATVTNDVKTPRPDRTVARIAAWARRFVGEAGAAAPLSVRSWSDRVERAGEGFVEEPVAAGSARDLYGVACRPAGGSMERGPAVLFVNTNYDHHGGWARRWVEIARAAARAGVTSLRVDLPGIGDSPARAGGPEVVLYSAHHVEATRDVAETLARETGRPVLVVGLCSGAHLAFRAAAASEAIAGAVLFNNQRFVWDPRESVLEAATVTPRVLADYRRRVGALTTYRRLITGQIDLRSAGRAIAVRLGHAIVSHLDLDPHVRARRRQVVEDFDRLAKRHAGLWLVNGSTDVSLDELRLHWGRRGERLRRYHDVAVEFVDGVDHNMTLPKARCVMERVVVQAAAAIAAKSAEPSAAGERGER